MSAIFQPTTAAPLPLSNQRLPGEAASTSPDFSAYPSESDLIDYLSSLGILNPKTRVQALALMKPRIKAQAAAQEWEDRTCWYPYLAGNETDEIRYFDPPGPNHWNGHRGGEHTLYLRCGMLAVTAITAGFNPQYGSPGRVLTEGADYRLTDLTGDYNYAARKHCIEAVQFTWRQTGAARSILMQGKYGRVSVLPADVWLCILEYGAYLCYQELALQISRGVYEVKNLNTQVRYAGGTVTPLKGEAMRWQDDFFAEVLLRARTPI